MGQSSGKKAASKKNGVVSGINKSTKNKKRKEKL